MQLKMITIRLPALLRESVAIKYGIGLWNKDKVHIKDLFGRAVTP